MTRLRFLGADGPSVVEVARLLVVGFTGRNQKAVADHVEELAALGVPVPASTPTLYSIPPELATQSGKIRVGGANTSGEVEPVLVVVNGRRWLTVGSDHTDRDVERRDIAASKAACPKVLASTWIPLDEVPDWDAVVIHSDVDDGHRYQHGVLASLLPLDALLVRLARSDGLTLRDGDVVFLGTVPVLGGIRPAETFSAGLEAAHDKRLELTYRIERG